MLDGGKLQELRLRLLRETEALLRDLEGGAAIGDHRLDVYTAVIAGLSFLSDFAPEDELHSVGVDYGSSDEDVPVYGLCERQADGSYGVRIVRDTSPPDEEPL